MITLIIVFIVLAMIFFGAATLTMTGLMVIYSIIKEIISRKQK